LKTVLIFSQKNFFYGQITLPLSIFNYLILFIFVVSIIIFYIIEEKNEEDHQPRKIKTFYIIISLILVLFFFIFQSNIYSTIIDYLSNLNNISLKFIYDLWINLFVEGEYKHLRFLYYIFFLGIVTILFYLPSILKYNIKSYKNTLITLPLALIFFVFITYYIINMRDERPERIYIYIIPFMIIGAIITLKDLKEKDDKISKKLTILFIVLLFISIAISSVSKVLNLSPHVKDETYYSIKWLKNNIDEKVYAQGSFSQILNSFDINSNGLYSYNIYELRRMKLSSEKEYIIDNKIYKAYTILNQKYGEEIKNKNNKIYSTKNAEIIEYN
ncbi:MAG: DUF6056 family protein, partial [Candidatus Woesearchaeota archaeon]